jgi:hypothetical protein
MLAQVYVRRNRGRRIPEREERNQTPLVGNLQFCYVMHGGISIAQIALHDPSNTRPDGELARLYEPVLTGLGGNYIAFRGYEVRDGATYLQEWRCYVGGHLRQPAERPLDIVSSSSSSQVEQ